MNTVIINPSELRASQKRTGTPITGKSRIAGDHVEAGIYGYHRK